MAIDIKFDLTGNPEPPTIILANRNGNKLGQLKVNTDSIELSDKFNDASEFSFTINKYINNEITYLWDKVVNFKLVYCKEWDCWFEIKVELDEDTETVKTVFCTQLGQAELSQIMLYDIEINTEDDIARDDYKISILYDRNDPEASILNRILRDKAPHYSIAYVSPSIARIQRSFSFDDISIYDALQEIGEEIGCLFIFHSNSGENGKIQRTISVYDLQQNCNNCGHRGEFTDKCPKCNNTDITYGYGEDTLIFVTSDELASNGIQLVTNTDSVKNCFKLEAGDDLMTATIRNCNPNGTDYIWYFSNDVKEDMSDELVEKLESYNRDYQYYSNEHVINIDEDLLSNYNDLIDKYTEYNPSLEKISTPIEGYSSLMTTYYNTVDFALFLESSLTPLYDSYLGDMYIIDEYGNYLTDERGNTLIYRRDDYYSNAEDVYLVDKNDNFLTDEFENNLTYIRAITDKTNAVEQASLLTISALSPISVPNLNTVSLSTLDSTVLYMAKILVKPTYKVEINTSEMTDGDLIKIWTGNFIVTNYHDDEDVAISKTISIKLDDDYENFIRQKIKKALAKDNTDAYSVTELFSKKYHSFCNDLKQYSLNMLVYFRDACQSCIDVLIEQGIGNDTNDDNKELYDNLYLPYYEKLMAIDAEIKVREDEINSIVGIYNSDGTLVSDGVQSYIEKCRNEIQDALDFKKYLGEGLWLEFCSYRREDKYSNENYISDGLNNAELFEKALEFFEVAENEIYKSSELQHSISATLNNLLAIPKFKPLVKHFKVGNWIRVLIDEKIYKLRLLEYGIDYKSFDNISVEFSDVTKMKNGVTDVESILSKASSMSTSYSTVKRQASQGEKSNAALNDMAESGLNVGNTKIVGASNQTQVWDKNGILCREYEPTTGEYSDEQLKIINSTIAITDDNWKTTKTAVGKYFYTDPITKELKSTYGVNGETIVGKIYIGEQMTMQNTSGTMVFDDNGIAITSTSDDGVGIMTFNENGLVVSHGDNTVTISPKSEEVMNITNGNDKVFEVNENGELSINGNIIARSLRLENGVTIDSGVITDLADVAISASYNDLINTPKKLSDFENDSTFITDSVNNLTNYYNRTETNNLLSTKANTSALSTIATSGSFRDLIDLSELQEWILEQIQSNSGGGSYQDPDAAG